MNAPQYLSVVDRIPPNNLEAEMALLGSVLVDKEMMATVSEIVRPEDFYASLHETIFLALVALNDRGEPLDKISLAEELRSRGMLDKVGGIAYLSSLMDTVATAASAEYYAKIVREKASLRGLIHAGTQITKLGYEAEEDVPAALDSSEQIVYDVTNRGTKKSFAPVGDLLLGVFQDLERRFERKGDRTGVTSGFRDIDEYTAGWQPGNLIIVAARPAMGKTSMALNMAVSAAKDERLPVAIFSLEMTRQELVERFISSEGRLDASKLRRGTIKETEWEDIGKAMGVLHDLPIYLDDSGSVTVTEIRSRCRRLKSSVGLAAVFIDYLQLVRPGTMGRNVNRNEELSDICRVLKATAKDLMVPIVALAQLNRGVEARQDKRPMLADLRDCLAADSLITNADTGDRFKIADIIAHDMRFNVWALDDRLQLVRRPITDAWQVGCKPVFRVTTQSGRVIRCTDGHRFLTVAGWAPLTELAVGCAIAAPRTYPAPATCTSPMVADNALLLGWLTGDGHCGGSPTLTVASVAEAEFAADLARTAFGVEPIIKPENERTTALRVVMTTGRMCGAGMNPLTNWLRGLGVWRSVGAAKHVADAVFQQSDTVVAAYLRGLFHADGCLTRSARSSRVTVRLSTISEELARGVQHLLLRFGINAILKADRRNSGGYRTRTTVIWTLALMQRNAVEKFMTVVGFLGDKHSAALSKIQSQAFTDAAQFDRIPLEVNEHVRVLRSASGLSHTGLGWCDQDKAMSRTSCAALATRLDDQVLETLAFSDVLWDRIVSITAEGEEPVFDITVGELHNFCVNDLVTHNSGAIEQEADLVTFLYRDAYYNRETTPEPDLTEFIIAKHRNGKVGTVRLRFLQEHTLFVPYGDESHFAGP